MFWSDEGELPRIHGSLELKIQIVLLAAVTAILGSIGFILLPLLYTERDPVASIIFACLLVVSSVFLGGSLVFAYYKMRVGAEARTYAEEMLEHALRDGMDAALAEQKNRYSELLARERGELVERLEREKKQYTDGLKAEFDRRLDEEEKEFIESHRREYEAKLGQERQRYMEELRVEFDRKLDAERRSILSEAGGEFDRRLGAERDTAMEEARREMEKALQEDKRRYMDALREEYDRRLEEERRQYEERAGKELERQMWDERRAYSEQASRDLNEKLEGERRSYMEGLVRDFESWKRNFAEGFRREMEWGAVKPKPPEKPAAREEKQAAIVEEKQVKESTVDEIFGRVEEEAKARPAPVNLAGLAAGDMLEAAVNHLHGAAYGAKVTFTNAKTGKYFSLVRKANREVQLEAPIENVAIKARLMLRENAAVNRLVFEKTVDAVKVTFQGDADYAAKRLGEAVEIAFGEGLDALKLQADAKDM